ncbi:MAG: menaquinone-dependent protoporphyrinogen IX dehydrogenase [Wenzhouxiangellaceae bacterium]|nr:menaquinone-dependent protoporphyrinogen IX dehydrogenase [Wenzhouxiangellaceae bacterium]
MKNILIIYATTDGHTEKICRRMAERIDASHQRAEMRSIADAESIDPSAFDAVAVGGSVRYGKHHPGITAFLEDHAATLGRMPNAFFSVNLVARKPEKRNSEDPARNPHVGKFLKQLEFKPAHVEIIAGKLDYPSYRLLDRIMIQLIMKMTQGPTDKTTVKDYTDWDQVDRFADWLVARAGRA